MRKDFYRWGDGEKETRIVLSSKTLTGGDLKLIIDWVCRARTQQQGLLRRYKPKTKRTRSAIIKGKDRMI